MWLRLLANNHREEDLSEELFFLLLIRVNLVSVVYDISSSIESHFARSRLSLKRLADLRRNGSGVLY